MLKISGPHRLKASATQAKKDLSEEVRVLTKIGLVITRKVTLSVFCSLDRSYAE